MVMVMVCFFRICAHLFVCNVDSRNDVVEEVVERCFVHEVCMLMFKVFKRVFLCFVCMFCLACCSFA